MIIGKHVALRPLVDDDWSTIEEWAQTRNGLWGPYQRFQLDHIPALKDAYRKTGLLDRDSGFGLHTMRERMELIGGTLAIDSAPGRGTRVIARVPGVPHPVPTPEVTSAP